MAKSKILRVAVCLSGQPRTWRKSVKWWEEMFSHHGEVQFDLFMHLWNYNSLPENSRVRSNIELLDSEIEEIVDWFKPVAHLVEGSHVDPRGRLEEMGWQRRQYDDPDAEVAIAWASSQFYGIQRAAFLKRQHEIDQDFEYDICIRGRTDILLPENAAHELPHLPKPAIRSVYAVHSAYDKTRHAYRMGDLLFYSDSPTFDRIASFYQMIPCFKDTHYGFPASPEFVLYEYMKMLQVDIFPMGNQDVRIIRSPEYLAAMQEQNRELGIHEIVL